VQPFKSSVGNGLCAVPLNFAVLYKSIYMVNTHTFAVGAAICRQPLCTALQTKRPLLFTETSLGYLSLFFVSAQRKGTKRNAVMGEGNEKALPQTPTPMVREVLNNILLNEAYKDEYYTSKDAASLWSKYGLKKWPHFDPKRYFCCAASTPMRTKLSGLP